MRLRKTDIDELQRGGAVVQRKKKAAPTPPPKAPEPPAAPHIAESGSIVRAIRDLGDQLARLAKEQPERKPAPYRFTINRNKTTGLIETCVAEPLAK